MLNINAYKDANGHLILDIDPTQVVGQSKKGNDVVAKTEMFEPLPDFPGVTLTLTLVKWEKAKKAAPATTKSTEENALI